LGVNIERRGKREREAASKKGFGGGEEEGEVKGERVKGRTEAILIGNISH
jgi:hypothetical protein